MNIILSIIISTSLSVLAIATQDPAACLPKSGHSVRCLHIEKKDGTVTNNFTLPEENKNTAGNNFFFKVFYSIMSPCFLKRVVENPVSSTTIVPPTSLIPGEGYVRNVHLE